VGGWVGGWVSRGTFTLLITLCWKKNFTFLKNESFGPGNRSKVAISVDSGELQFGFKKTFEEKISQN